MQSDLLPEKTGGSASWSRVSLRAQGVSVLLFPMAVLFAALFTIYWADGDVRNADSIVARAYETRVEILQLRSSLLEAETAESSPAETRIRTSLDRLPSLIGGTAAGTQAVAQLRKSSDDELRLLAQMRSAPAAEKAGLAAQEKAALSGLQSQLSGLGSEEERILTAARASRDAARRRLFVIVVACGTLGPLGALFIHLLVTGRLVRRIQDVEENARRLAHGLPLEPLPPGTDEIAALARQLEDAAYLLSERENELRGSERRYRDLFNQAPIPYEETNCEGVVTRFNQAVCTLLKCTPDQILGRHAWDFVVPDQQENVRIAMLDRIARGLEAGSFECDYMLDDGSRIAVEIRENITRNEQGRVTGVVRSLMDVTERNLAAIAARKVEQYAMELRNKNEQLRRALDAARSATEAKSRFLASVSHELRTPLNGIIGFSEMMHDGRLGAVSEEQQEVMSDILISARHLLQLINDILDLSKVEAGKMEFRPEIVDIETLVTEVRDIVRPLAEKKNLRLTTDVPHLRAVLDPGRFKQVLYNYLSNAVKFTARDGSVSVRVSLAGEGLFRLDVEDTGSGIPPAELSRLFQEFQQLPNSRKAEQGTGLGLALTRHIVEAQGGKVAVESELGRGSVFSAILPLTADNKTGDKKEAPAASPLG